MNNTQERKEKVDVTSEEFLQNFRELMNKKYNEVKDKISTPEQKKEYQAKIMNQLISSMRDRLGELEVQKFQEKLKSLQTQEDQSIKDVLEDEEAKKVTSGEVNEKLDKAKQETGKQIKEGSGNNEVVSEDLDPEKDAINLQSSQTENVINIINKWKTNPKFTGNELYKAKVKNELVKDSFGENILFLLQHIDILTGGDEAKEKHKSYIKDNPNINIDLKDHEEIATFLQDIKKSLPKEILEIDEKINKPLNGIIRKMTTFIDGRTINEELKKILETLNSFPDNQKKVLNKAIENKLKNHMTILKEKYNESGTNFEFRNEIYNQVISSLPQSETKPEAKSLSKAA